MKWHVLLVEAFPVGARPGVIFTVWHRAVFGHLCWGGIKVNTHSCAGVNAWRLVDESRSAVRGRWRHRAATPSFRLAACLCLSINAGVERQFFQSCIYFKKSFKNSTIPIILRNVSVIYKYAKAIDIDSNSERFKLNVALLSFRTLGTF